MRVTLQHDLSREEVRRRMRNHADEIAGFFPPGLANVTTGWSSDDRMDITAEVMGMSIPGRVDVGEDHVVISMDLPMLLSVMKGPLEAAVKKEGQRLLAP
ncbi:polyhydroxyalkanoic acid system family protein [Erythrobacter sp. sf7]|uniref:Polyhydroxyalkanoic acid system family protein n=1 Tax=Erythrobacter fulvus TaxID=2987523 RepID=A0ABT5JR08_9SPHN|nr:polyhydroxyalkanoic acid system family protein [Erythrobacter fulvus]MDC8754830.1 polyhydroxyalkanoic acid system family protein [Erythrobacter fulvus]